MARSLDADAAATPARAHARFVVDRHERRVSAASPIQPGEESVMDNLPQLAVSADVPNARDSEMPVNRGPNRRRVCRI